MTVLRILIGLVAMAAYAVTPLGAQGYPVKPVRVIVPTSPGGVNDVVTRLVSPKLAEALGQAVVVENHPPTVSGTAMVAKASPDGYTLLSIFDNFPLIQVLYKDVPYDALRDFTPVILTVRSPMLLAVPPTLGVRDLTQFLQLAKSKSANFNYASAGAGTSSHLTVELFKSTAGIDAQSVHYKGAGPAVLDLIGGRVQFMIAAVGTLIAHVKAGKLVPLAVTGPETLALLPNVPTIAQAYRGFEASGWQGMVAPAGTPNEIIGRLNADIGKALRTADVRRNLEQQAYEIVGSSSQVLGALVAAEHAKWVKVIREQKITLN
ncbi:MAG: hypothetical protein A3H35_05515 [Betaproteobacteria bacterium RIFCSPLOWO2_02_FULL_62_17]|nr:MAG: hypothetical protein A3H35_05515 [Betaproteobacteria bacterium RIFCSPLOWO2_02_FULL_62_17]